MICSQANQGSDESQIEDMDYFEQQQADENNIKQEKNKNMKEKLEEIMMPNPVDAQETDDKVKESEDEALNSNDDDDFGLLIRRI